MGGAHTAGHLPRNPLRGLDPVRIAVKADAGSSENRFLDPAVAEHHAAAHGTRAGIRVRCRNQPLQPSRFDDSVIIQQDQIRPPRNPCGQIVPPREPKVDAHTNHSDSAHGRADDFLDLGSGPVEQPKHLLLT